MLCLRRRLYQEALRHDERHAEAMMSLARLHMDREELDEARKQCTGLDLYLPLPPPSSKPDSSSLIHPPALLVPKACLPCLAKGRKKCTGLEPLLFS